MPSKVNYANQKNTPCNENAQLWYYVNAVNKFRKAKNPIVKAQQLALIKYYLNGNGKNVLDN